MHFAPGFSFTLLEIVWCLFLVVFHLILVIWCVSGHFLRPLLVLLNMFFGHFVSVWGSFRYLLIIFGSFSILLRLESISILSFCLFLACAWLDHSVIHPWLNIISMHSVFFSWLLLCFLVDLKNNICSLMFGSELLKFVAWRKKFRFVDCDLLQKSSV